MFRSTKPLDSSTLQASSPFSSAPSVNSVLRKTRALTRTAPPAALTPIPSVCHPERSEGSAFLCSTQSPATKSFRIRTYEKCTPNPFGIRTSKTRDLKSFRIRTYEKSPRGEGHPWPESSGTACGRAASQIAFTLGMENQRPA
jgi:hypothetical protein